MTAYVALQELPLEQDACGPRPTTRSTASRCSTCAPGEQVSVRDLLYGLILRSGNDAAYDLARAAAGSEDAFVGEMNRRASALGLADTHYANPIGLDEAGNYSSALDLAALAARLLRDPGLRQDRRLRSAPPAQPRPPRRIVDPQRPPAREPWVTGVKTGHTFDAGYVLVGSGRAQGGGADLGRARRADRGSARRRDAWSCSTTASRCTGSGCRSGAGEELADAVDPLRRRRAAAARRAHGRGRHLPRPAARASRSRPRTRSRGRSRRGAVLGRATVLVDGRPAARRALRAGRAIPEASAFDRVRSFVERHTRFSPRLAAVRDTDWSGPPVASARRRRTSGRGRDAEIASDPHRHPQRRDRPHRRRPQLPPRPPPPRGREPHRRRRQGRQRRPRPAACSASR